MPWNPEDAERHTHKATTPELRELWAKVANESLERDGDEGRATGKQTPLWRVRHEMRPKRRLFAANERGVSEPNRGLNAKAIAPEF